MAETTVTVLLFARYAELVGRSAVDVAIPPGATVSDVVRAVSALPGGSELPGTPLVAVNQAYAAFDERVRGGDEIALIPPVAGG